MTRCVLLCILEAAEGVAEVIEYLLEVPEVPGWMHRALLCMLETTKGELFCWRCCR